LKIRKACYLLILLLWCCRKPYNPAVVASPASYLVVEGTINTGGDSTIIKLSKTVNLSAKTTSNPVLGATVFIENNQSATTWPLTSDNRGNYVAVGLSLPSTAKYRLAIKTTDGSYQSDFVPVISTPPIDSVGYTVSNGNVNIYVNTHDPINQAIYYRWDYQETWIFHAKYMSTIKVDTATESIVTRLPGQYVYYCFGSDASSDILIASTQHLSEDVVYRAPVIQIPLSSEKVEQEYSILVKQYALPGDGYIFYQNLQQNSEDLGSIFAPLPSTINGNIHALSNTATQPVGYISATNVQSKRIFILESALPNVATVYPYDCEVDTITSDPVALVLGEGSEKYVLLAPVKTEWEFSSAQCGDCTVRGTTQTPSFWK